MALGHKWDEKKLPVRPSLSVPSVSLRPRIIPSALSASAFGTVDRMEFFLKYYPNSGMAKYGRFSKQC